MKQVNAFIVPGRYLYVTSSLMRLLPTDDALALVVGHELAHGELGHLIEFRKRAEWKDAPAGDAAYLFLYLLQRFVSSPANERDADAYGLDLALKAGYEGDAYLEAFAILERHMMSLRHGSALVTGPEASYRQTDDALGAWKAKAEVWLYEHLTGYPSVAERRLLLADRLAHHRDAGRAPYLLPGSRRSTADVHAGFLARLEAIDQELDAWATDLTSLAADLARLMRSPTVRRLADAVAGDATQRVPGLDGRTAREAESALATITETARQTTAMLGLHERAKEVRGHLSADHPPASALDELLALLFAADQPSDTDTASRTTGASDAKPRRVPEPAHASAPRRLLARMRQALGDAAAAVASIEAAWARWEPALEAHRQDLDLLRSASAAIGADAEVGVGAVEALTATLAALQRRAAADPLDLPAGADASLRAEIEAARADLLECVKARRSRL
jgi:hypothetical protein